MALNQSGPGERTSLGELALLFLKLGTTAFGGPAAHIAMMEDEVVGRRRWLTRAEFLDYLGATNLIPGPNSTELAIHIGHARAGWTGLTVAGVCFIVPATLIVGLAAWGYVRYGALPQVEGILYGVKPVVIAIIAQALVSLGRAAVKTPVLAALGLLAVLTAALGVNELLVLAACAALMAAVHLGVRSIRRASVFVMALASGGTLLAATQTGAAAFSLSQLFLVFAKIGSVLFGSGYVLLAFLRADFVERLGWLTEQQLLDAIAVGQVTPGPLFTTATFIGYLLGGLTGAAVATAGIFLPAFIFVAISGPIVPQLRRSALAGAVLDGVNVASLALMTVVSYHLARASLVDGATIVLAIGSTIALAVFRVNSAWLLLAGAAMGWVWSSG